MPFDFALLPSSKVGHDDRAAVPAHISHRRVGEVQVRNHLLHVVEEHVIPRPNMTTATPSERAYYLLLGAHQSMFIYIFAWDKTFAAHVRAGDFHHRAHRWMGFANFVVPSPQTTVLALPKPPGTEKLQVDIKTPSLQKSIATVGTLEFVIATSFLVGLKFLQLTRPRAPLSTVVTAHQKLVYLSLGTFVGEQTAFVPVLFATRARVLLSCPMPVQARLAE